MATYSYSWLSCCQLCFRSQKKKIAYHSRSCLISQKQTLNPTRVEHQSSRHDTATLTLHITPTLDDTTVEEIATQPTRKRGLFAGASNCWAGCVGVRTMYVSQPRAVHGSRPTHIEPTVTLPGIGQTQARTAMPPSHQ